MQSDVELFLYVTSVRPGEFGGAIFRGYEVDHKGNIISSDTRVVAKADYKTIKHGVYAGQVWWIQGQSYKYTHSINGYKKVEDQIDVRVAKLHSGAGDNFIAFMAGNDAFKGIGETKARKLWLHYGKDVFSLLPRNDEETVCEIGAVIGEKSARTLLEAWKTEGQYLSLVWLDEVGLAPSIGQPVIEYYGHKAKEVITEDPYRLAAFCISWKITDAIALHKFDIEYDDPRRLRGAVEEALYSAYREKHTALSYNSLKNRLISRLQPRTEDGTGFYKKGVAQWVEAALQNKEPHGAYYRSEELYHPAGAYLMEQFIAEKLFDMQQNDIGHEVYMPDVNASIEEYEDLHKAELPCGLADAQKQAVVAAVYSSVLLVSGGAGTGKTTVLKCIYHVLGKLGSMPIQMALAGRAAKRMQDATNIDAYTIAAFIKNFTDDAEKLSENSCVVIDEASMVDVILAYQVFNMLPEGCRLILVGDEVQLPPIGPGLVFHTLVKTSNIERIQLTEVKRQDDSTGIPQIAASVREHRWPTVNPYHQVGAGVSFKHCDEHELSAKVLELYDELGGTDDDVRIIAATKDHSAGIKKLNHLCQEKYRSDDEQVMFWSEQHDCNAVLKFRLNDPVMWLTNDYQRGLRNGSLGVITEVYDVGKEQDKPLCRVDFEGNEVDLKFEDMDKEHLSLAYAITCHKAQGSQFKRVIIPVYHWNKMDQSWIYTALTRGVERVVFVGDEKMVSDIVKSPPTVANRVTGLPIMLYNVFKKGQHGDNHEREETATD